MDGSNTCICYYCLRCTYVYREHFISYAEHAGSALNEDGLRYMLVLLINNGELAEAERIFAKAQNIGVTSSETLWVAIIQCAAYKGHWVFALKYMKKMRKYCTASVDLSLFNFVMKSAAENGGHRQVIGV
jgi:hypothetical protein